MKLRIRVITVFVVAIIISVSLAVFGQGTTSRLTGTVVDTAGAVVPGATISLIDEQRGTTKTTISGNNGNYTFDLIEVGVYTVSVEKAGFKKVVSSNNVVNINQPATVNFQLEVGDVSAVVNVESTAELVQTNSSGNLGTVIDEKTIEAVPIVGLRGRNPLDVVDFQPGVVVGANTGGGVHVSGSRDRAFNFTLDGIDINEASAGGSNFTPLRPNPDSIQEFQIVTSSATAELGRSSGASVTFVTKAGTNDFHGNLFEYYQTPDFNANETANNLLGIPRRKFIQHIYGGSLGGPIINPGFGEGTPIFQPLRDKAFFFVNLQFLSANETNLVQRTVYTPEARAGLFRYVRGGRNNPAGSGAASVDATGNPLFPNCSATITTNCIATYNVGNAPGGIDPTLSAILNSMPTPNDYASGDGLNIAGYNFLASQKERQWDFVSRFDYKFSDTNTIYARYAQGRQETFGDTVNGGGSAFPGTPILVATDRQPWNLAINHRFSPTANTTNEFIFGISEFSFDFIAPEPDPFYNFEFNLVTTPNTNVRGNSRIVRTIQFVDNLTYVWNSHLLKTGINFRFGRHTDDRSSVAGTVIEGVASLNLSSFPNFGLPTTAANGINSNDLTRLRSQINDFLGRVGTYRQAFVSTPDGSRFAAPGTRWEFQHFYPELDFYFQDSWKVSRNFLLDLGIRYEVKLSPSSEGLPVLVPDQMLTFDAPPTNTARWVEGKLFPNDYNNFGPSLGFAWDVAGDGKTSVRGNFRLSYDRLNSQVNGAQLFQNAPGNNANVASSAGFTLNTLPTLTPSSSPDQLRQPPRFDSSLITVMDPRNQYPEVYSWSASFQRELGWKSVLEINYIGKRGEHLFGGYNGNQANINAQPTGYNDFLSEFIRIQGDATYNSELINALFTGSRTNNNGTALFRNENGPAITSGSVASVAAAISSRPCRTADVTANRCTAAQVGQQLIALNGFSPFLFQQFPQFGTVRVLDTNDYSRYQGLELIARRRFSNGLTFQASYTWSISKDTRSFDPTFTTVTTQSQTSDTQSASSTPIDNANRDLNYAWSDFDRRHVFNFNYVYELPFGRGRKFGSNIPKVVDFLIGGWQIAGLTNYSSGRPFTVWSGSLTYSSSTQTPANCDGCSRNFGQVIQENGTSYYFSESQRTKFSTPDPGQLSNTGRNYFIGAPDFRADVSLSKKFRFTENVNFDLRLDAKNVFNNVNYGLPTTRFTSSTFGRIRTSIDSDARIMQLSGKFNF